MDENEYETSNSDTSSAEQGASEDSSWDETSDSASICAPTDAEEGDLTQFLMDTFGHTDETTTTFNDLIEL